MLKSHVGEQRHEKGVYICCDIQHCLNESEKEEILHLRRSAWLGSSRDKKFFLGIKFRNFNFLQSTLVSRPHEAVVVGNGSSLSL